MLIKKYKPKKTEDIIGQDLSKLKDFILNYKKQKKKAAILYGISGTGKTSSVYALANELDLEVMEINASDYRNAEHINSIVGNSLKQSSLFNKGKIILIDDVDGLSGQKDRGGVQALNKLLAGSNFPVILTAIDPLESKLSALRRKSLMIEFEGIKHSDIFGFLKKVSKKEKINVDDEILKKLSRNVCGDLRAALNDLDIVRLDKTYISERDRKKDFQDVLRLIFKSKDLNLLKNSLDYLDLNEFSLWLDENLPKEYSGKDLAKAYDVLSRADVFKGRILRWQYYRFLVYQSFLMSSGIAFAKEKKKEGYIDYKRSGRILKLWIAKQKYTKRKSIAEKIATKTHNSIKRTIQEMPYMRNIIDPLEFGLDEEEFNYLKV